MNAIPTDRKIGVVGAGTMGAGIAQLAAAAGHPVILYDAVDGAAEKGMARVAKSLDKLVAREKMAAADRDALLGRIDIASDMLLMKDAAMVVEAIVEDLEIKRQLFEELEDISSPDAILATNTSSISVTAIARELRQPERVVGMHFFNPAPVMKLVEVISGIATAPEAAETVFATAEAWGKVAVHARSTPGFIVNRVARPFYGEALRLYEEQVADPSTIDALLVGGGGFRMGPFALMDLIGNDVNYAVSESVFNAFYQEPRFRPSMVQLELVNAGHLGRKSGRGFFDYSSGEELPAPQSEAVDEVAAPATDIVPGGETIMDDVLVARTDGRTATTRARDSGRPTVLLDLVGESSANRIGFACSPDVPPDIISRLVAGFDSRGLAATRLPDWPGLVVMRTVAMIANEAFEAVLQGVAERSAIDKAMQFGVNYPRGPIEWAEQIGLPTVLSVLDSIHDLTGDPRYRASFALRQAAESA